MHFSKTLILFLFCTLQTNDASLPTFSTSISSSSLVSSSSASSVSSMISSKSPINNSFKNQRLNPSFKIGKRELINDESFDLDMEFILNPNISSLSKWIMIAKEMNLPNMFKKSLGTRKRWDILISINRWLMEKEKRFSFDDSSLSEEENKWIFEMLKEIYDIVINEKDFDKHSNEASDFIHFIKEMIKNQAPSSNLEFFYFNKYQKSHRLCNEGKDNIEKTKKNLKFDNHYLKMSQSIKEKNFLSKFFDNLNSILKNYKFPQPLFESIKEYIYDEPVEFEFEKAMSELRISDDNAKKLDFYSDEFASKLVSVSLSSISLLRFVDRQGVYPIAPLLSSFFYFRPGLYRLFFKWIIYIKEMTAGNNAQFMKILKGIKILSPRIFKLASEYLIPNNNLELDPESFSNFKDLIYYEVYDYHSNIFPLFASAVEYSYLEENDEFLPPTCYEFKNKFFNGNYNTNIILQYLIIMNDPKGWMRNCIIKENPHLEDIFPFTLSTVPITREYIDDLKINGPDFHIKNMTFANKFTFEYLLKFNKTILFNRSSFFHVIKELKKSGLLKKEILEKLFKFTLRNGSQEWNQEMFKELLSFKNRCGFTHHETNECLKLFDSSPLRLKRITKADFLFGAEPFKPIPRLVFIILLLRPLMKVLLSTILKLFI